MSFSSEVGNFDVGYSPIEGPGPPPTPASVVSRIYDNIQMTLGGVTSPLIDVALWNAIEEFAIRSTYFRQNVFWQMAIGVSSVDFNPFSSTMLVCWVLDQHGLVGYRVDPPAMMVDLLPPNAARTGSALLALKPVSLDAATRSAFVGDLWSTWFDAMLDGTFFRIYNMPAKPWTSPQMANYHGTRFRQAINRARDIAERQHTSQQSPRRAFPYFARGRRKN